MMNEMKTQLLLIKDLPAERGGADSAHFLYLSVELSLGIASNKDEALLL